jgi:putative transposase
VRPVRKRKLVDAVCGEWDVSIRRACRVLEVDTSTYHYKSRRPGQAGLEQRIKEICQTRVRYGYRRVHVLLRREGWCINQKKTRRIYRELGLQLRNKTPKRRVKAKLRADRRIATRPNETWAMDFVHDQLATGRKLRVLTVVDTFSRFSPVLEPRFTFRGADVVEVLEEVGRQGGSRRRSGSIKAPSSSRVIWTCGLISAASYSTSRDQASRPTTHSLKRSTDASERNV